MKQPITSLTALLFASLGLLNFAPSTPSVTVVDNSQAPCIAAVAASQKQLTNVKNVRLRGTRRFELAQNYPGFPADRPYGYNFRMDGSGVETVMNSPQFLKGISQNLIASCGKVSLVSFGVDETDWYITFGLMGKQMEAFKCLEPVAGVRPAWGEQFCP